MASAQPKKPMSAYWLFISEHRASIEKEIGTKKVADVAKKAGEQWKALSDAERKPYEDRAKEKKASYEKALEEFKAGGGVVEKRKSSKMKKMKVIRNPDAPKRMAGGPYGLWLKDNREKIAKSLPKSHKITDVAKAAGQQWKALGSPERRVYKEKFATKAEEYKKEVEDFKAAGGETQVTKRPLKYGEETAAPQRKRKMRNEKRESREEKRKREDDAALAAIDRMRASRSVMVGA